MNALSDVAMIERIAMVEAELARLRVDAYMRAGIPLPGQSQRMGRMIEVAAITFNVSVGAMTGAIRSGPMVRARFAVMWAARQLYGYSTPVIGRALGNRDHSTVISGIKRAEELREKDQDFREITDGLIAAFTPKLREEAENAPSSH
jgi:chromosomal replication initiation ATPase DnaA